MYKYEETTDEFSGRVTLEYFVPIVPALGVAAVANAVTGDSSALIEVGSTVAAGVTAFAGLNYIARKLDLYDVRSE